MNEKNLEFLKENLKYMGFGEKLYPDLEKNISQQFPEFSLKHSMEIHKKPFEATLHFRKGDTSDLYFFNRWDGKLLSDVGKREQSFYINKGQGITAKEGFNLLNGRAVYTDLTTKAGEKYQAWIQLNFSETDQSGNFKMKQFVSNYGYDLEQTLSSLPISELQKPDTKDLLLRSLQRGNLQSVTLDYNGSKETLFLAANPQFKSLQVLDVHGNEIKMSELARRYPFNDMLAKQRSKATR